MQRIARGFIATFLLIFLQSFASVAAEELPVSAFSALPEFERPRLSPSGNRIAFVQNVDGERSVSVLTTLDLTTGERNYILQSDNEKISINWYRWANDEKLIVSSRHQSRQRQTKYYETRMFAVDYNHKGGNLKPLIKPRHSMKADGPSHISQYQDNVIDWLPDEPDYILVAVDVDKPLLPSVYKVNINTRRMSMVEKGKRQVRQWMTDQQGRLRIGVTLDYNDGARKILVRRNAEDDDWDVLFEFNTLTEAGISPIGFGVEPHILYYKAYENDKLALYTWDLKTDTRSLVYSDPDYDVSGGLLYSPVTRDVIGISHANTERGRVYWDERYVPLHNTIDKLFAETDNYLVSFSQDENVYILYAENDYTPGTYLLGNRKQKSLGTLFDSYAQLNPEVLPEHELVTYEARDGLTIEGYLTLPLNKPEGPIATILHPHGGPGVRDYDGFDYWTSFFANRGYAVFRPNFRGSSGYGYEFAQSQMKSWGLEMQDDLTDATHWLIEQGIADPEKICIVGASYGGYAAMMAAVKTPELFSCGVSFAGVSNLRKLVTDSRRFVGSKLVKNQIGDDSDDLKARSPYYQTEKIQMPMLIVHGEEDRVVDVKQSRMFVDELEDEDKLFEYIELESGDHYLSIQRNRHVFFEAMDRFLKTHLK